jgi:hypothetical protein
MNKWFEVDTVGLRKLIEEKGPVAGLVELIQNGWDQDVTRVDVIVQLLPGRPAARVIVEDDDPKGFTDLDHAYTLFAESMKKGNPDQRGRFNMGEKLALSLCYEATISSTTGTVRFDADGRHRSRLARESGSRFDGIMRMTRDQYEPLEEAVLSLIPPTGIVTTFNGRRLRERKPLKEIRVALPTEIADDEGVLRKTTRQTTVRVYESRDGIGRLYEMGIPVVATGDKYDIDIAQKVPLGFNRDNVPPAYLRLVRTCVLNAMHAYLTEEDANTPWVREAASDSRCSDDAITSIVTKRFGDYRVSFDPGDPEGTKLAASEGFTVVHGGAMSAGEWANARRAQAIFSAGQVTPSPRVLAIAGGDDSHIIPEDRYSPSMQRLADYAREAGQRLLGMPIHVRLVNARNWTPEHSARPIAATFGNGVLTLNVPRIAITNRKAVNKLLIHEFAHHFAADHLSEDYHDALCRLGADFTELAIESPEFIAIFHEATTRFPIEQDAATVAAMI